MSKILLYRHIIILFIILAAEISVFPSSYDKKSSLSGFDSQSLITELFLIQDTPHPAGPADVRTINYIPGWNKIRNEFLSKLLKITPFTVDLISGPDFSPEPLNIVDSDIEIHLLIHLLRI